jgi:thiamine-phosphate pyrophosphorylase
MANLAERARRLNRGMGGGFALLTDELRLPDPMPMLRRLPAGSLVVLRHYGARNRDALAQRLARACRARRLIFLVADDFSLAVSLGAGLHLPEARARMAGARIRLWHRQRGAVLSVAAHSRMALLRAARLGADLALLSPVFATASHPGARPLGMLRFRALARDAELPVWALGGVTGRTMRAIGHSAARGAATVGNLDRD